MTALLPEALRWWWLRRSLFRAQRRQRPPSLEEVFAGRRMFEDLARLVRLPQDVTTRPATADGVPVEWLRCGGEAAARPDDPVLLYVHGGAYTMGSIAAGRGAAHLLARATGLPTLHLDHRLAPEHPFPAGRDDLVTVYRWLLGRGHAPGRIVLAGDSAGGGLLLAALVAARAAGLPMPAAAAGVSTWADLELTGDAYVSRAARDPLLRPAFLRLCAELYVPDEHARRAASVLHADLTGLPPLLLAVGADEIVHDDSVTLVARARAAGVDARLHVADGRVHCWTGYVERFPSIEADLTLIAGFLRDAVAGPVPSSGAPGDAGVNLS